MTDALPQGSPLRGHRSAGAAGARHLESAAGSPDPTGSAALRIAIVGPTHPHQGRVAAHTTMLAHQLVEAGHDVTLVSWAHLHPSGLHHADASAPDGQPEVPPFPRTIRALSWARPDTWVRAGRRLRDVDVILVVHVRPAVVPAHLVLLRAAGAVPGAPGPRPQSVVVCHDVLASGHGGIGAMRPMT